MNLFAKLSLSDTNQVILLFCLTGLLSYFADYRVLKEQPDYGRDKNFAKAISYVYVFGGVLAYIAFKVLQSFV